MSGDTVSVIRPRTHEEAAVAVRACGARGVVARGGPDRALGDAARNAGGAVLDMTGLDRVHVVDAAEGIVLCDAGLGLHRLAELLLPLGWSVPAFPAARHVTVGGAIGADLHGCAPDAAGSFSRHVVALELLTADGEVRAVRPDSELFGATAGGLGLTGVILTATVRLLPVETAYLTVGTERAADLDDLLARLAAPGTGRPHGYAAARIDLTARGAATGRAVLTRAGHAPRAALRGAVPRARRRPLSPRALQLLPPVGPLGSLVPAGIRYLAAPRAHPGRLRHLSVFRHPLDTVSLGGRCYGRLGRVRYQFAVGHGQEEALHRIVRRVADRRCPSARAVLQRLGAAGPGWLSCAVPGWSLALDLPVALPGLAAFLDGLDEEVAAAGGRVGLARDCRLRPDLLTAMYPRATDFRALRARLDPRGVFISDLARRLAL
ncbi:FAD-binding oxidoreductase [Streptomyces monashensis]|uniref:Decaprenylphosphoryl-beta-D-ribose oxidase n=1 Tax=Streptomyces monashensis TaxID=1678012 RepID=A0A1S2QFQ1_9ACTN|nr:FAD-binding oxidoreductase [Streptomyces monashensis]OIK04978.1 decaprenylphosphoryl-beta-D-ribose oxidase [Streptomyces monashensis]